MSLLVLLAAVLSCACKPAATRGWYATADVSLVPFVCALGDLISCRLLSQSPYACSAKMVSFPVPAVQEVQQEFFDDLYDVLLLLVGCMQAFDKTLPPPAA